MSKCITISENGLHVQETTQKVPEHLAGILYVESQETDGKKIVMDLLVKVYPKIGPIIQSLLSLSEDD